MKDSLKDYLACILFRVFSFILRILPVQLAFFLGRRLGDLIYFLDPKHRARVRANIRKALSGKLDLRQIKMISREFYRELGQSIVEVFLIPAIDKKYLEKYVTIDGLDNIYNGLKRGKGVILMVVHEGSWELSNIVSSLQGYPFNVIVRDLGMPRLNNILNVYRRQKGAKTIDRENQLQEVIRVLKNGEALALTIDQGGAQGVHVKFFGRDASMASGAIKLALKYDSAMLPVFISRIKGPQSKITIRPSLELKRSGNSVNDLQANLQEAVHIFEDFIAKEPKEYLWTYKIWKHGLERDILILWDGRAGHLRQAQAAAALLSENLKTRNIEAIIQEVEVKPGAGNYAGLKRFSPDFIISCGASTAKINYRLSKVNQAKSIVIMRPGLMSINKFDLAIIPRHDNPPERRNVVETSGALNLIDEDYLKEQAAKLNLKAANYIGLLLGGPSKKFALTKERVLEVARQLKKGAQELGADILISTSRRTPKDIENLIRDEFKDYPACKLLVIANEKNIPEAVGGILGLSSLVIISPESISMVSEAASSGKHVLVFKEKGLSSKHARFLEYLAENKYIHLTDACDLAAKIAQIHSAKLENRVLQDSLPVKKAMAQII
ncbi:MAG: ELM1/GtrOC1 family putative glycosyltransferase [Candidatus Omnitrophica bacterium]|nr:ELM1/GtrOC1 family putative glycosyltransferase [Candidatus Omnitrophota bacterium]